MSGLLAKKIGMTQVYDESGDLVAVTVLEAGPCTVTQKKTKATDGYDAIQLGFQEEKERLLTKPLKGHFAKKNVKAMRHLEEFRPDDDKTVLPEVGEVINASIFKQGDSLKVSGTSKGKGFQGVIKRHGKAGGPATHGSRFHRTTGSIGQRTSPGEVFKNMKLPGQMGNKRISTKNLRVVQVRAEQNLILVAGAVPGCKNNIVSLRKL